jgi:hypothetical protein
VISSVLEKSCGAFTGAIVFGALFIWVGGVRLRDTLKGEGKGSKLAGVVVGAASIAFGLFVLGYCYRLATSPPSEDPAAVAPDHPRPPGW